MRDDQHNLMILDPSATATACFGNVGAGSNTPKGAVLSARWFKQILYVSMDVAALIISYFASIAFVDSMLEIRNDLQAGYVVFFACFFAGVLYLFGGYGRLELRRPEKELEISFKAVSYAFVGLLAVSLLVYRGVVFSRHTVLIWYLFSLLLVTVGRFSLRYLYASLWGAGLARQRALLIGSRQKLLQYRQLLSMQRCRAYDFVGTVARDCSREDPLVDEYPVLGGIDVWEQVALSAGVELVVIDLPTSTFDYETVLTITRRCQELNLELELFSEVLSTGRWNYEFDHFTGCFRLSNAPDWSWHVQRLCKSTIDRIFGVVGSCLTISITPLIGVLILLEDPGPIFHKREYVGSDGVVKHYRKFRTMVKDADAILQNDPELKKRFAANHKLKDDPRVLKIGGFLRKYSIDEFPQFFSVLSGRLSLVGPRVISLEETSRYGPLLAKRLSVPPGITGYWQVMGRQTTTYDERIQMDMFYVDHWSIWLDLVIIAKTFFHLIHPEGAY